MPKPKPSKHGGNRAPRPLTPLMAVFCQEFIKDLNGTQAVLRMGRTTQVASAANIALRWLRDARVQAEIARLQSERGKRLQMDADWVLRKLRDMLDTNLSDVAEWDEESLALKPSTKLTPEIAAAIVEVSVADNKYGTSKKIKIADKGKLLELAMRHLRMFEDRDECEDASGVQEFVTALDSDREAIWDDDDGEDDGEIEQDGE